MTAGDTSHEGSISSQSWYHGKTTRVRSEAIVKEKGDFLVRDSISQPGEFVLTAFWKKPLHFQINSTRDRSGQKVFQFEEEEFTSVVHLIHFYQTHKKPVTLGTGCIIQRGIDRNLGEEVLSATGTSQELEAQYARIFRPGGPSHETGRSLNRQAMVNWASKCSLAAAHSTTSLNRPPPLPASLLKVGLPIPQRSPPARNAPDEDYDEMDYDSMEPVSPHLSGARSVFNGHYGFPSKQDTYFGESSPLRPTQSCEQLVLNWRNISSAPSSPTRRPSLNNNSHCRPESSSDDSSDSGHRTGRDDEMHSPEGPSSPESRPSPEGGRDSGCVLDDDYDIPKGERMTSTPCPPSTSSSIPIGTDRYSFISTSSLSSVPISIASSNRSESNSFKKTEDPDYDEPKPRSDIDSPVPLKPRVPPKNIPSSYTIEYPRKPPIAVKPIIEPSTTISSVAVQRLRNFILDRSPSDLAVGIGGEDARLLGYLDHVDDPFHCGVSSLILSSGHERRDSLRTRSRLTQLVVLISCLSPSTTIESSRLVAKWILAAAHALKRHGNHFAFANIMRALSSKQLDESSLWSRVEPVARDEFKSLAKAYSAITVQDIHPVDAVSVSIPFIQPILDIFDTSPGTDITSSFLDTSSPSKEFESTFRWLESARDWSSRSTEYSTRAQSHYAALMSQRRNDSLLTQSSLVFLCGKVSMQIVAEYILSRKRDLFGL